jgi:hypothetical protein
MTAIRRFAFENGLSLVLLALFSLSLVGHALTGRIHENEERAKRAEPPFTTTEYLRSGAFTESVFENWESEFLQMALYVVLTVRLRQKGSAESKPLKAKQPVDEDPRRSAKRPRVPWPVRRGGWVLRLYESSLGIALGLLFVVSFALHAVGGARERIASDGPAAGGSLAAETLSYLGTSRFWFESFQNWQSEFLSVAAIVILSVYLRQRGSPESKPVASPHDETGE